MAKRINFNPLSGKFDFTEASEAIPYYQYIYNSSGPQSGNRFNDWADLIAAIDGRKAIISFEQDETLPTGAWFHGNIQWSGTGQNPDQGAPVITLPTGFTFSNATNWNADNGLNIESTSVNPIYVQSVATSHFFDRCFIGAYNAPFFEVTSNGLHAFAVFNGGHYKDYGYPIVQETTADPYGAIIVFTEQGVGPSIQDDTLATTNPQVVLNLKQSATLDNRVATYAGLNPAGVLQNQLFANASVIGFKNGNPTGISAANVTAAFSEVVGKISDLDARIPTNNYTVVSSFPFGSTSESGPSVQSGSPRYRVSKFNTGPNNGTVIDGRLRLWLTSSGSMKTKMVVYSDNAGVPDTLIGSSDEVSITNTSAQFVYYPFSTAPTLSAYTDYWIGGTNEDVSPGLNYSHDGSSNGQYQKSQTYNPSPMNPWSGGNFDTGVINAYLNIPASEYTIQTNDNTVEVPSPMDITLPTAVGVTGKKYDIVNSSGGTITINTTSSEIIGNTGSATSTTVADGDTLTVISNGEKWRVIQ